MKRPWFGLAVGLFITIGCMLAFDAFRPKVGHNVSAASYATIVLDGLVQSNGAHYAQFTIQNQHSHPINVSVNNLQVRKGGAWRYYAADRPGGSDPRLGDLGWAIVPPGLQRAFVVPCPDQGDGWRINVGVLRGIQGLTARHRLRALQATHSLKAALSNPPHAKTNYFRYTFAGMLQGPEVPRIGGDSDQE